MCDWLFESKEEKAAKAKELRKNVEMTEHSEDLEPLLAKLKTNAFFSLLLWGASAACFVSYSLKPDVENLYLGIVLAAVWVTGCFSYLQNRKSDNMMAEFKAMRPPKVKVVRNGEPLTIDPALCSPNMCVDNSSLTGESEPQKRKAECTHEDVLETANLCFFGTQVPEGRARPRRKIADDTVIGRIAKLALSTEAEQTPINKEIHRFILIISAIAIILGVSFFCARRHGPGRDRVAVFMIGIIVANVPEGLLATVTVCLTLTAKRMYTKKVMVKNLEGVETLGSISLTCSTLCNTCYFEKYWEDEDTGKRVLLPFSKVRTQGDGSTIVEIQWKPIGNASEGAMIKFAHPTLNETMGIKDIEDMRRANAKVFDIPFNSKNKYQNDRIVYMKGAPERVLIRCTEYMAGDGSIVPMTPELAAQIEESQMAMGNNGLRPGFAMKKLPDDKGKKVLPPHPLSGEGLIFLGLMALVDPPREAVPGAVAKCKTAGIKVIMVTGDHPGTAKAIAYKVGILWSPTKDDIEKQNKDNGLSPGDVGYQDPDAAAIIVFARTSPQQKLVIVSNCQRLGHVVAVTGDGVNDSPALKKADIGIAMGIAGTPVTKNAADMILLDDNFASIVAGVEEGRLIFDNLKKSICYTLTSNIPEISPFLCWITMNTPMPLSTVLILAIDLGTDMVPAISMAYEDAEADIMKRPPRNAATDHLVTSKLICLAYLQIGVMQAMAGFYAWMLTMYCKFNGGQYVNGEGEIDPANPDPTVSGPNRNYPMWDRGDGGYIKACTYPAKNFQGGFKAPTENFYYEYAATYTEKTNTFQQPTIESIWALNDKGFFEYTPWRGRLSPFWDKKWVSFNIHNSEYKIAKAKAGAFGFQGARDSAVFQYQPAGVWSICLGNDGDLDKKTRRNGMIELELIKESYEGFDLADAASVATGGVDNGGTIGADWCNGKTHGHTMFQHATFCNGQYKANGDPEVPGCDALDDETPNLQYCQGGCGLDCTEKKALMHAQAAYWVSIVVVQWADLLICKTRWLSIRQQGLRNSVLNFGLFFETLLAAWLCYGGIFEVLGTQPIRFTHWMPGIPGP
ncbi:sodium:potassium-exchanging ATPase [Aureococcus anophagefferens]|nr:sodium:potassium-exchanging ATPase [Aureococcus anophagefferens]